MTLAEQLRVEGRTEGKVEAPVKTAIKLLAIWNFNRRI